MKFKKNNATVAFRTSTNRHKFLREKQHLPPKNQSGVYRLKCDNYPAFYIGQNRRAFEVRYTDHLQKIKATSNKKT